LKIRPKSWTIALKESSWPQARKLTKIVAYKTGGFCVLVPYHKEKKGWLIKASIDYSQSGTTSRHIGTGIKFSADDRVKLSYHPDGFVQFSGEVGGRIISGRDPDSGEIKGLGTLTQPLNNPIITGPSFAVSIWGLDEFDLLPPDENACLFTSCDLYHRRCTPEMFNGYVLEAFIFPDTYWGATRGEDQQWRATLAVPFEAHGTLLEFRMLPLAGQPIVLGLVMSRAGLKFKAKSGYCLNGPGGERIDNIAQGLWAIYPRPDNLELMPIDYVS